MFSLPTFSRPKSAPVTRAQFKLVNELPEEFDWRNVSNQNFVSPIRNQGLFLLRNFLFLFKIKAPLISAGSCGSCYAFASMAMLEARYRVMTKNLEQLVFSPQDVVECSQYSQGVFIFKNFLTFMFFDVTTNFQVAMVVSRF